MASNYNPVITKDGLIFLLDPANRLSYPGSGTSWNDLSNNRNNATLSSVAYGSINKGLLYFDGVYSIGTLPYSASINAATTFTLGFWFKSPSISTEQVIFSTTDTPGLASGWHIEIYQSKLTFQAFPSQQYVQSTTTLSSNTWYYGVVTYSNGSVGFYVNGVAAGSGSVSVFTASSISSYFASLEPFPTPTPSPTLSPTPTPSPTLSPTPTPSPTLSPTPTPTPSPTLNLPTGGTVTTAGGYRIHTFTGSDTFYSGGKTSVEYLIVGGGGGGGGRAGGGGGGGGGALNSTVSLSVNTNYPVVVGGGGLGGFWYQVPGTNGSDSSFAGSTALGGGAGGTTYATDPSGKTGGCGGGGSYNQGAGGIGLQGSNGSAALNIIWNGGGGGGASGVTPTTYNEGYGGNGGLGYIFNSVMYGSGGGGASGNRPGIGGDGAGDGSRPNDGSPGPDVTDPATRSGLPNRGGGGGGEQNTYSGGGLGGSGIVIIRYAYP